jgi:DnaK suppressor protein
LPRPKRTSKKKPKPAKKAVTRSAGRTKRKATKKTVKKATKRATKRSVRGKTKPRSSAKKSKVRTSRGGGVATIKKTRTGPKARSTARGMGLQGRGSKSRIEELRAMLEAKRLEIIREIKRAREDSIKRDRTSFAEVGDLVSASVEKERAFEYGEAGVNVLREIDTALGKLKAGTYGVCELCGKPIGVKRLKVVPSARLCIKCKAKEEAIGGGGPGRSDTYER